MAAVDWMMVFAVMFAPVLAVQASQYLDRRRESDRRRRGVFQALMATRAAKVSAQHVEALNSIDLEFQGTRLFGGRLSVQKPLYADVRDAWKVYLTHLNTTVPAGDAEEQKTWNRKTDQLLVELLHVMGKALGYNFDRAFIERGIYSPVAHGNLELDQLIMRRFWVNMALGKASVLVRFADDAVNAMPGANPNPRSQETEPDPVHRIADGVPLN